MDTDWFLRLVSGLATTPSRRAVTSGLASLAAGSVLAPLIGFAGVEAKKKKKKKNRSAQKCKAFGGKVCTSGKKPQCCNYFPVCTECGCCPSGTTTCCSGATGAPVSPGHNCCGDTQTCCYGANGKTICCDAGQFCCPGSADATPYCCSSGDQCCDGFCCHAGEPCCAGTDGGYCCRAGTQCCDGVSCFGCALPTA